MAALVDGDVFFGEAACKMNVADLLLGVASGIMSARSLRSALAGTDGLGRASRGDRFGREARGARGGGALAAPRTGYLARPMKAKLYKIGSLNERVKYIREMIKKGRTNPEVRAAAVKALSKKCGKGWCLRERDWTAEVRTLFQSVRGQVRYTRDPYNIDLFQHPLRTLEFGGGDCFPEGTLFVTRDGFVRVEDVEVGDEIHDGERWVKVVNAWDRGPKDILRFGLNNGSILRLSGNHKVLRVPRDGASPGRHEQAEQVPAEELRVRDDLLQPRGFEGGGSEELDPDEAFLIGAYLAEGCRSLDGNRIGIAGVADRKGIRERLIAILTKRGVHHDARTREIRFRTSAFPMLRDLGRVAIEKHLPHFRYGPRTVASILEAMEMGDGGWSTTGKNMVYSTISSTLALQYRVLQRMMGRSVHWATVVEHGGFGTHAIHRLTVRSADHSRPWAKIWTIEAEENPVHCYDLATESGRVYLPMADVTALNCDDYVVTLGALLQSVGYPVRMRVVRTKGSRDWNHIYLLVGMPPRDPTQWVPLDASVPDVPPGWQPPKHMLAAVRDFPVE